MAVVASGTVISAWFASSGGKVSIVSLWTLFEAFFSFVNPFGTFEADSSISPEVWEGAIRDTFAILHKHSVHTNVAAFSGTFFTIFEHAWVASVFAGIEFFWAFLAAFSEEEVEISGT